MENITTSYPNNDSEDYKAQGMHFGHISYMVALSVVSLLGTVGNGLVIWFVVFKMKKTVNSVWFLSLAVADFTFSLLQPLEITRVAFSYLWPFGDFMCKLYFYVVPLNMFSSILQLTVISIDRCACVVFPVWCQNHRTTRLAWMVTLGVWVLAAGCSAPFFIIRETYPIDDRWTYCYEQQVPIYWGIVVMQAIFLFVVPLIIIISCYTVIIVHMRRNRMVTSTKPLKMITAIITCFFICWLPYHVFYIMWASFVVSEVMFYGWYISFSLAYANSCLNPFLYVFFGRDFKEKFWGSIQSALRRAFTEEFTGHISGDTTSNFHPL